MNYKGAQVIKKLVGGDWLGTEKKNGVDSFQMKGNFCMIMTSNSRLRVHLDGDVKAREKRMAIARYEAL